MKTISLIYVFSCLLFFQLYSQRDFLGTSSNATYSDVAYATKSATQKLDIYLPLGEGPFPVVVIIHGGAFMFGDKNHESRDAETLVKNGFAAVSINYRLSEEARFPAQIQDCKAAIRFLRANATKYKLNPDKIASWGASAGGNLSALLGTSGDIPELEGSELGNSSFSSRVTASVDWFGPINFLTMDAEAATLGFTIGTNSERSPESKLMGAAVQTIPDLVAKANPTTYITKDDAAFLIQVGDTDRNIPYTQSKNFYNALVAVKGSANVDFELLKGAGHGGPQFSSISNMNKLIAFLNKYLK
ncbi:MAG: alpha/beta hydrolase [Bacteroidetes bacterium]|nr:alpha/beta hydrolase [Bacteroidota bacterium]